MRIFPLTDDIYTFPNPRLACNEGILAYGGDLSAKRLISAYANGIFPWYNEDEPILWWSPNPRLVMELDEFKVSKSLAKAIKKEKFEVKFDENFTQVMIECKNIFRPTQDGTWLQDELIQAYTHLHEIGYAHSFESYYEGELVGGGYGLVIGDMFCGESMFAKKSDASKVALYHLVQRLKQKGFSLLDCQTPTEHLQSLGAKCISRDEFLDKLAKSIENFPKF
ncbi:leucyl/phenylalanyl-tRNA--protein transferase [Malaciobacter marinus]|uniref:Leucyl/phenylalanyl-tRNA--protein transferase n=1 Tax=Malaciobacter marinus TaxID=505249 RepID=A0A347TMW0_9BACT|nr:leucyl/phenylalanyl-tRNA--protein transferase [Malaciobacter marinus]AXX87938.1 leucyl, phenylalanyl-tRNA-protein transferase [Malaciobacter marinus]PHO13240.1 leucyl/phenylalanyl-tRNA--protein transferase [Malaciobacter marinus]PHO15993.1 leucyl/phenylalanyl-tRNA--protein transferase [Malaciobacter marinus]